MYCNNCGKSWHLYRNCLYPIMSYGILLFRTDLDKPKILVRNKIDLVGLKPSVQKVDHVLEIAISAKNGEGVDSLQDALSEFAGLNATAEGVFLARKRHINAIEETLVFIRNAIDQLKQGSSELVAEDLRQAGLQLSQITGEFSSDDLLGEIFSSFCIGK